MRFNRVKKEGGTNRLQLYRNLFSRKQGKATGGNNQQLDRCLALADLIIINDGSLAELHQKLEKLG